VDRVTRLSEIDDHWAVERVVSGRELQDVVTVQSVAAVVYQNVTAHACMHYIHPRLYTVSQKKTRHQTLSHNFTNYYPIFNFFSLSDSAVNLQQIHV